jgi:hypothetical protein
MPYIQESPRAGKFPYDAYEMIIAYRGELVRQKDWDVLSRKKCLEVITNVELPKC